MSLDEGIKVLEKAIEEDRREYYYKWWLARHNVYNTRNYESFEEFYEKMNPQVIEYDTRNKDEIMEEILGGDK